MVPVRPIWQLEQQGTCSRLLCRRSVDKLHATTYPGTRSCSEVFQKYLKDTRMDELDPMRIRSVSTGKWHEGRGFGGQRVQRRLDLG
jgi:hypothetical protein